MLLRITTHSDLPVCYFHNNRVYQYYLKKGTYLCRKIVHPFGGGFDDLIVLYKIRLLATLH